MASLLTYWHTIRQLRAGQIYGRLHRRATSGRIDLSAPPPLRRSVLPFVEPARRRPSMAGPRSFEFLNVRRDVAADWNPDGVDLLWLYNLHYFDDLNAEGAAGRRDWHVDLLTRWVRENPPGEGTAWEAYPTSLRIVNWIKWALAGNDLPEACNHSLAVQARWLASRLETHLLGNHLLSNAKALVFAGLYFDGPEATGWLQSGVRTLERELREQILADGGHFELSPMYHAIAMEDVLDLCNVGATYAGAFSQPSPVPGWRERVPPARSWLRTMCHPDGEIGFFNDAAMGIAPTPLQLEQYCDRLGVSADSGEQQPPLVVLAESGYARAARGAAVAIMDVAAVGPTYLPGHAHADTLSFELSLFGQRLLVNSGTGCYGQSAERLRQRGTSAHNTVVVDGENSSEVWSGFRVGRRARPKGMTAEREPATEEVLIRCAHDGYRRLPGRVEHERVWRLAAESLEIADTLSGRFEQAEARYHLHPSVTVASVASSGSGGTAVLHVAGREVVMSVRGGLLQKEPSTWHPGFGVTELSSCLAVQFRSSSLATRFSWARQ